MWISHLAFLWSFLLLFFLFLFSFHPASAIPAVTYNVYHCADYQHRCSFNLLLNFSHKKFCLMCSPKSVPSTQSKCLHITVKPWIGLTQKLLNWNATVSPILLLVLLYCYLATRAANEMWRIGWAHHASNKHSFSKNLKCNQHINLHFQLKWCNDCTCTTMPSKNFRLVSLCLSFLLWLNLRLQCLETTGWTSGRASSCQKYRSSNFQRFLCKTSGNHQLTQVN